MDPIYSCNVGTVRSGTTLCTALGTLRTPSNLKRIIKLSLVHQPNMINYHHQGKMHLEVFMFHDPFCDCRSRCFIKKERIMLANRKILNKPILIILFCFVLFNKKWQKKEFIAESERTSLPRNDTTTSVVKMILVYRPICQNQYKFLKKNKYRMRIHNTEILRGNYDTCICSCYVIVFINN